MPRSNFRLFEDDHVRVMAAHRHGVCLLQSVDLHSVGMCPGVSEKTRDPLLALYL